MSLKVAGSFRRSQIVARVFISADENRCLKDQTNRQGIVDSPQLEDFKAVLKEILSKLEAERDGYDRLRTWPKAPDCPSVLTWNTRGSSPNLDVAV
jgi:hypothetical protein